MCRVFTVKCCSQDFAGARELQGFLFLLLFVPAVLLLRCHPGKKRALSSFVV